MLGSGTGGLGKFVCCGAGGGGAGGRVDAGVFESLMRECPSGACECEDRRAGWDHGAEEQAGSAARQDDSELGAGDPSGPCRSLLLPGLVKGPLDFNDKLRVGRGRLWERRLGRLGRLRIPVCHFHSNATNAKTSSPEPMAKQSIWRRSQ
jgi:hypothetical protein